MSIKEKFKSILGKNNDPKKPEPEELDGAEERLDPLSKVNITYIFCTLLELKSAKYTHLIAHELSVPEEIVDNDLNHYLNGINGDTVCCLEYPYIEEYYRDTYYTYYARKHHDYNRHCFRVSFFASDVTEENFFSIDIKGKYWGYVVLRPTPRRIIGYSFISPLLFPNKNISICICKRLISVLGRSLETVGFPFLSHDGESVSCSENSILMVFDYYSRRYNNYSRVLPSHLFDLRTNYPCKYQPSIGLSVEEVVSIFNNLGMTTRTYHRKEDNPSMDDLEFASDEFEKLIEIFVESGIPIYVSTTGHAYLLIGRENKLFPQEAKFVAMDGCEQAYFSDEDIHDIQSFVVPMPDNILLDAHLISPQKFIDKFNQEHPEVTILEDDIEYYHRIFLTTSRSFKKHIVES